MAARAPALAAGLGIDSIGPMSSAGCSAKMAENMGAVVPVQWRQQQQELCRHRSKQRDEAALRLPVNDRARYLVVVALCGQEQVQGVCARVRVLCGSQPELSQVSG